MPNHDFDDDARAVWRSQPTEPGPPPLRDMQSRLLALQRRVRRRNLREYGAIAVVVGLFGYGSWASADLLSRIGSALEVAGALYVAYQLHRRASARVQPRDLAPKPCADFYRAELERQRDALRSVWSWYILPFVPGIAVELLGSLRSAMASAGPVGTARALERTLPFGLPVAVIAIVFYAVWKLNQSAAGRLQARINALEALRHEPE